MTKRKAVSRRQTAAPGRSKAAGKVVTPAIRYLESSAVASALLEGDVAAKASIRAPGRRLTSALTVVEVSRAIIRARVAGRITDEQQRAAVRGLQAFARRCDIVGVADTVLTRAGRAFPVEPVRTLDAIHLATLEALGELPSLATIVTRDVRIRENALALGYGLE